MYGGRYTYSMRYYEARKNNQLDHGHDLNLWLVHQFNERFSIDFADTLTVSQEPTVTEPGLGVVRSQGNNFHNNANVNFHAQLTRALELVLGYRNDFYDYETSGVGSYSALLDRVEHYMNADLRWRFRPETVAIFGYRYGIGDYTSSDFLAPATPSNLRDWRSHYVYVGLDHAFSRNFTGSVKVGGEFVDHINANQNSVSPTATASLRYTYRNNSFLELGVQHQRNATDAFSIGVGGVTTDQETTAIYGTWQHAITARLTGILNGQYSHGTYDGGTLNNQSDDVYVVGVSAEYHFTRHFSAEIGYNYDHVESNIVGRSYDRNRVFLGMNVAY
jgi:long-subunit fatty acid transport protein